MDAQGLQLSEIAARPWRRYVAIGIFALLVPVLLTLTVLPTASSDTRELMAWGHFFTLTTSKHPPLMQWLGGITERVFGPTAFAANLVNQLLNALALAYAYLTLRLCVDPKRAALFTLLLASSVYMVTFGLPFALNADTIQMPIWAGAIYHALRARETNWLGHWLWLGLWCAVAVYAKYSAVVLFTALGGAALVVPEFRSIWRNPWLYLAVSLGLALVAPHLIFANHSGPLAHARVAFGGAELLARLVNPAYIFTGVLLYLAPGWLILAAGLLRGDLGIVRPDNPIGRFLLWACILAYTELVVLTLLAGLVYRSRFDAPFLLLAVLAAAVVIELRAVRWAEFERQALFTSAAVPAAILVVTGLLFGVLTGHPMLQEPTAKLAGMLMAEWQQQYPAAPPAYVLGDHYSGYGVAIAMRPPTVGVQIDGRGEESWFDPAELKARGAIVVYRGSIDARELAQVYPGHSPSEAKTVTLRLVGTLSGAKITYAYLFIPPGMAAER